MSNRLDMKKDTNNRKDKTKYDGPEKPDAYICLLYTSPSPRDA